MSGEPNFLSRWSRLKRQSEVRRARQSEPAAPGDAEPARAVARTEPASAIPELTPEELAALPRLEELTPETDLAPFMRLGVPASLRNAALRKMWALDPAIRDRVGDALDYAYDWNLPGSVPGSGPLLASDDVQAMLRAIVGAPESERGEAISGSSDTAAVAEAAPAESQASTDLQMEEATKPGDEAPGAVREIPADANEAPAVRTVPKEVAQLRRHGRATPF